MRKQLLTSAAVLALSAGAAFASDLPTHKGPPPAPTPAPYSWTGFLSHASSADNSFRSLFHLLRYLFSEVVLCRGKLLGSGRRG